MDRDGTLIEERQHLTQISEIEVYAEAYRAVRRVNRRGLPAVVVTNQSVVGRGLIDEAQLEEIHQHLARQFRQEGGRIDAFYHCPHHPTEAIGDYLKDCGCRKPRPGMLRQAADDFQIDLKRSWMIGDTLKDIQAGHNAGCRAVLVRTGYGRATLLALEAARQRRRLGPDLPPDRPGSPEFVAEDILEAVNWILEKHLEGQAS